MKKEYTKEQFVEDLFEVANVWREGIMLDLAGRTDELWENEIAKKLVRKCAEARRESTKMRKQMFVEAMRGTEEHDEWCDRNLAELAAEKSSGYTNMVYELLVRNN